MKKQIIATFICLTLLFIFRSVSFSVPSRNGKFPGPKEGIRPRELVQVYDETTKSMRAIRKTGTINVAVIPVSFNSQGGDTSGSPTVTSQNLQDLATNMAYLHNFYNEAAYGIINVQFTVIFSTTNKLISQINGNEQCITLPHSMSWYGTTLSSVKGTAGGQPDLIQDAVTKAGITTTSLGGFDTVIIVHAGYGNESTSGYSGKDNPGDIWSVQVDLGGVDTQAGNFSYGIVVPVMELDSSPRGVCCHEFGHFLGLPDMYNTANENSEVGEWCLMDMGPWVNNGYNPTHPCAWCKQYLGLVNTHLVTSNQQISNVPPIETSSSGVYQLNIPNSTTEYFLVCYTTTSPYNLFDPGTGVLIWHVDNGVINGETLAQRGVSGNNDINCYTPLTAALLPAGGEAISDANNYYGGPTDPWPQSNATTFASPNSDSYSTGPSSITISNFQLSSSGASFYASVLGAASPLSLALAGTPNYQSAGFYPSQGAVNTPFVFEVKYIDTYNSAPAAGYPQLSIMNNGVTISTFSMVRLSTSTPNYVTGEVYMSSTTLALGTTYTYFFTAVDTNSATATGALTQAMPGPKVYPPFLNYVGSLNYITSGVYPSKGTPATSFGFEIQYMDYGSNAPMAGYPKLFINNGITISSYTMQRLSTAAPNYASGEIYCTTTTLPLGSTYTYYFQAYAVNGTTASVIPAQPFSGPTVSLPTLSFVGTSNYQGTGVYPAQGNTALTSFVYQITYTNPASTPPASGYPKLYLRKNGVDIAGSPFTMTTSGALDYTDGQIYSYSTILSSSGLDYTYFFKAYDVQGVTTTVPAILNGPSVFDNFIYTTSNSSATIPLFYNDNAIVETSIPAGSFPPGTYISETQNPTPASDRPSLKPTGLCSNLQSSLSSASQQNMTITINYTDSDVSGFDKNRLYIARYDSASQKWVLLTTNNTPSSDMASALTTQLGVYALMALVPSTELDTVWVYPNPFYPAKSSTVIIENIPDNTKVNVFTLSGQLIKPLDLQPDGRALWDGKNSSGNAVASGIYLISLKDASSTKVYKLAIIK